MVEQWNRDGGTVPHLMVEQWNRDGGTVEHLEVKSGTIVVKRWNMYW